ncbi:MAG: UDP-4-amino-4,6-dideoxy-N-acetyl-beta-L-altrosamine transaminase [Verrucomicrobiota bacterium]
MIAYGKQLISQEDVAAVERALLSDFLTCGPEVEAFETEIAARTGAKHAIAACNATAALHLAVMAGGVKRGERVLTSPNTFLASANCVAYAGAIPDFVDINTASGNMDPKELECRWKPDTTAVIAVDFAGQAANMPEIAAIARRNGALVIEDAAHSVGGALFHEGAFHQIGGHPWADITIFSFHPVKTLTTGEGGMLLTSNDEIAARARRLRTHGMERNAGLFQGFGVESGPLAEVGPWVYEMQDLGYNYRITDLQCALGRAQLGRLDSFLDRRRSIVAEYNAAFDGLPWLRTPRLEREEERESTSWHLYSTWMDFEWLGRSRTAVMAELRDKEVGSQVLYIPVYLQPWYRRTYGYKPGYCPRAEALYAGALSLPLYPGMTDRDVKTVIEAVLQLATNRVC